jgi:hypothetical protein
MTWWMILACIALVLILVSMGYLIWRLEKGKDQIAPIISLLSALFLFVLQLFKPTELPPITSYSINHG